LPRFDAAAFPSFIDAARARPPPYFMPSFLLLLMPLSLLSFSFIAFFRFAA